MFRVFSARDVVDRRVLVRVDYNVPLENGTIADDFRIRATLPTLRLLRRHGSRSVILLAHLGRPRGHDSRFSLAPVAERLGTLLREPVKLLSSWGDGKAEEVILRARSGSFFLLENLRFDKGEEENDPKFAQAIARLGNFYINDAFGDAHRAHASIVALPALLPSSAGPLLEREVRVLSHIRDDPRKPFVALFGGAKVKEKLRLVEKFLPRVSGICLGGILANTALKARGIAVGKSVVDDAALDRIRPLVFTDEKLHLPIDVLVSTNSDGNDKIATRAVGEVRNDELILDIGPETQRLFSLVISRAKTIFWNGPMGLAELPVFRKGTEAILKSIAASQAFSVIGGGDTTRYPFEFGLAEHVGFLSTGGGAMLEFLSGAKLAGLEALKTR